MMIDVRGVRTKPQETDPAQRYVLKEADRKSRLPAIFGIFLVGIAIYLKSVFPGRAGNPDEGKPSPDKAPEGQEEAQLALADTDGPRPALDDNSTGTVSEAHAPGGSGRLVDLMPAAEFMMIEPPAIDNFRAPDVDTWWKKFQPLKLELLPANDNAGQSAHTGSGSAGGDDDGDGSDGTNPGGPGGCEPDVPCEDDDTGPEEPHDPCEENPQGDNRAPRVSGPVYLMDVTGCAILAVALSDLLRNAVDPDGDVLAVENLRVSSGTLSPSGDGWIFQGGPRLLGPVTITYEITDGEFSVEQTAHFNVGRSYICGTDADDMLLGTMCADDMDGGDGNDNMDGRGGDDVMNGGAGNDHIVAGAGDDTVFGGSGDDIVFGGPGNDHISGGAGNDRLFGEEGDDVIFGDAGDDSIDGGAGNDVLSGGSGNDTIAGGTGNDTISGDEGDDILAGGSGNDTIDGGSGNDWIEGGSGNDTIMDGAGRDTVYAGAGDDLVVAAIDGADDFYDGGSGCDTLDYSNAVQDLTIDLVAGTACSVEIGEDSISGFETVIGGQGDDHFVVGSDATALVGGDGDDVFEFVGAEQAGPKEPVIHKIMDFQIGDRIRMSKYDLFEEVLDELEDRFEDIYGDSFDDDDIPLRIRHDWVENMKRTVIEADLNRDDIYETTVTMQGHHVLVIVENV